MAVPLIVFPIGVTALLVAGEHLKASRSRWTLLASKYPGGKDPELEWNRSPGLIFEYREGNTIYRTAYSRARSRGQSYGVLDWVWERLFPQAQVAVSPDGLHIKRRPWNYKHPPLRIPWKQIVGIKTMTATEYAGGALSRQTGIAADKIKVPKLLSAIADRGGPALACVTLASPKMTITLPAEAVADASDYLTLPAAPSPPVPAAVAASQAAEPRRTAARTSGPMDKLNAPPQPTRQPAPQPAVPPPRANPLEHLLPAGSADGMALLKELTSALIAFTPQKFAVICCTIKKGTENGRRALFYDIQCPQFPDEGTTVVDERVHKAATRLVQQMAPGDSSFPGISIRMERQNPDNKWRSRVKLLAA